MARGEFMNSGNDLAVTHNGGMSPGGWQQYTANSDKIFQQFMQQALAQGMDPNAASMWAQQQYNQWGQAQSIANESPAASAPFGINELAPFSGIGAPLGVLGAGLAASGLAGSLGASTAAPTAEEQAILQGNSAIGQAMSQGTQVAGDATGIGSVGGGQLGAADYADMSLGNALQANAANAAAGVGPTSDAFLGGAAGGAAGGTLGSMFTAPNVTAATGVGALANSAANSGGQQQGSGAPDASPTFAPQPPQQPAWAQPTGSNQQVDFTGQGTANTPQIAVENGSSVNNPFATSTPATPQPSDGFNSPIVNQSANVLSQNASAFDPTGGSDVPNSPLNLDSTLPGTNTGSLTDLGNTDPGGFGAVTGTTGGDDTSLIGSVKSFLGQDVGQAIGLGNLGASVGQVAGTLGNIGQHLIAGQGLGNVSNQVNQASNPLAQPQRAPFQTAATNMVNNPSGWMQNDPFTQALTAQYRNNVIPRQVAQSGNAANVIDTQGSQFATALGSQYNQQLGTLLAGGGFTQAPPASLGPTLGALGTGQVGQQGSAIASLGNLAGLNMGNPFSGQAGSTGIFGSKTD